MKHPGKIRFEDAAAHTAKTVPVDEVPEELAWGTRDGVRVPVVRVVAYTQGERREIHTFGPDGRRLSSTQQRR